MSEPVQRLREEIREAVEAMDVASLKALLEVITQMERNKGGEGK